MNDRRTKRKRVAIFGHFGSSNFGNESTLRAVLYHLRCFQPDAEVTCICSDPEAVAATHHIEAIPIVETYVRSWVPRSPVVRAIRRVCVGIPSEAYRWARGLMTLRHTDMLIVPGTGLLTDAYGLLAWGPYNLFKWSLMARLCRCKLLFVSVGAGPIHSALGRRFVKSALSLASFRSYRDNSTKQYLESIGFRADEDRVYPDLVFSLPEPSIPHHDTNESRRPVAGLGLQGPVVGLGLPLYPARGSVPRPTTEIYLAYLENLVSVASWLPSHGYDVRLLIGDLWDVGATQEFKDLLRERLPVGAEADIVDEPVDSVDDLLSKIAATDIVVATRFHNVLLALLCNKPVIAISFHHKCESLMSAMGLSKYCLDINGLRADQLIERFCDLEMNADKVKPLIRERVREFRKALDEQYQHIFSEM